MDYTYSPDYLVKEETKEQTQELLKYVDTLQIKQHYMKIELSNPYSSSSNDVFALEGIATQGNISVNGNSAVRRSGSLTMIVPDEKIFGSQFGGKTINKVTQLSNLIAINKRAKISIGYENTGSQYKEYDMFWFPLGVFTLQNPSVTYSNSGIQVQVKLSDLMTLLNGTNGGELQNAMTHSPIGVNKNGEIVDDPVLVNTLIKTLVVDMGGINASNVKIYDVPEMVEKQIVCWGGSDSNAYIYKDENDITHISTSLPDGVVQFNVVRQREPLGTKEVAFTYPGELTSNPGETIVSVLDKIKKTLGNYEYFFDVEGNFIFQKIKNYLDEGAAPDRLTDAINEKYFYSVSNKAVMTLDKQIATSYSNTPKFDAIKNDFVVWGKDDNKLGIRYHLLIDKYDTDALNTYDCQIYTDSFGVMRVLSAKEMGENSTVTSTKIKASDWRHELYLSAVAKSSPTSPSVGLTQLEKEVIEELPKIFDVIGSGGYFQASEPFLLSYWLDRINIKDLGIASNTDYSDTVIHEMAISDIGDRPKTYNDDKLNCLFMPKVPDVNLDELEADGRITDDVKANWTIGTVYNPAFDYLRSVLHEHTSANNSISLQTMPMYYLEPNIRVQVENDESDIHGEYVINNLTMPLTVNGMMSISASKAVERI